MAKILRPAGGQANPRSETFEEGSIHFLFELADLCANGGLRAKTRLRGFGETLQPDNFEKGM